MLNNLIKEQKFTSVILEEPDVFKCVTEDGETKYYTLGKEALNSLYARIGLSFSTSKDLFNKDRELWENMKITTMITSNSNIKGLAQYRYVTVSDSVIFAFFEPDADDISVNYEVFDETYLNKDTTITINKAGVIQIIQQQIMSETDNSAALCLIDIDPVKGTYVAYDGVLTNDLMVVMSSPIIKSSSFYEFMTKFEPLTETAMALKFYPNMVRLFYDDELVDSKISVRETLDLIKKAKCELTLDDEKKLISIDLVGDIELVKFINSFKMPYKSLEQQEMLKKSLTYGEFTTLQMLKILSQNYKQPSNTINATMLSEFIKQYMNSRTDRNIVDECIPDIQK